MLYPLRYPHKIPMKKQISSERKTTYYFGGLLMVIGGLLFASSFVTFFSNFGNFDNFEFNAKSIFGRALAGMAFLIVGGIVRAVGARGLAGSGVILDPDRARKDLEPYSRMTGGMVKDALDEADIDLGACNLESTQRVVMIRCRECTKLNEEDSKFCQECGQAL